LRPFRPYAVPAAVARQDPQAIDPVSEAFQ
jgi:hypothetical protein